MDEEGEAQSRDPLLRWLRRDEVPSRDPLLRWLRRDEVPSRNQSEKGGQEPSTAMVTVGVMSQDMGDSSVSGHR